MRTPHQLGERVAMLTMQKKQSSTNVAKRSKQPARQRREPIRVGLRPLTTTPATNKKATKRRNALRAVRKNTNMYESRPPNSSSVSDTSSGDDADDNVDDEDDGKDLNSDAESTQSNHAITRDASGQQKPTSSSKTQSKATKQTTSLRKPEHVENHSELTNEMQDVSIEPDPLTPIADNPAGNRKKSARQARNTKSLRENSPPGSE